MHCTGKLCSRVAHRCFINPTVKKQCVQRSKSSNQGQVEIHQHICQNRTKEYDLTKSLPVLSPGILERPVCPRQTGRFRSQHLLNSVSNRALRNCGIAMPTTNRLSKNMTCLYHTSSSCYKQLVIQDREVIDSSKIKIFCSDSEMDFKEGHSCIITTCPRFTKRRLKLDEIDQLYINKTTGYFVCHSCKQSGTWDKLEDNITFLQDYKEKKRRLPPCFYGMEVDQGEGQKARDFWKTTVSLDTIDSERLDHLKRTFDIMPLSLETLTKYQVHTIPGADVLVFPMFAIDGEVNAVRIMTYTAAPDTKRKSRGKISARTIPRVDFEGLFGLSASKAGDKVAILTSNELDALAVYQETGTTALALPKGISTLPQKVLPVLEQYSSIILWLGDDVHSWMAAKQFSAKLGKKRCFLIRPESQNRAPLAALREGLQLPTILKTSRPIIHDSIATFSDLRQDVFSELAQAEQMAGTKWKKFPRLNELLKGHRRGELTVFTGPTGSGKTTFISEYSLDLSQQGVNTLWGSFEINNVRLVKTMLTQFSQINLTKNLDAFNEKADMFEQLPMYFMTFHGEENIRKVIETMSHAVYVHDISHVIVDNLQFMMGSSNLPTIDRYSKQDALIAAFRNFATKKNCHVTLVIHPRKERDTDELSVSSIFGSAKATQEADNVLILQDRRLTSLRARKYLQVVKNRYDGDLGVMVLRFNKDALSFSLKPKEKSDAAPKKSKEEALKEHLEVDSLAKRR